MPTDGKARYDLNKSDFLARVAEVAGADSKAQVGKIFDAVIQVTGEEVAAGRAVSFNGFGSFDRGERKAGKAKNLRTGEAVDVPAKYTIRFKASKTMKDRMGAPPAA